MRKESDVINYCVARILDIPDTVSKEEAGEKIRNAIESTVREMIVMRQMASIRYRENRASGKGTLKKAAKYYHDSDRKVWIALRAERYPDQLQFVDAICHWYVHTMNLLPPMLRKVMNCILETYHKGITPKEIARLCWKSQANIASQLQRLRQADFVERKPDPDDKRGSIYYVPDINWLRVHALRWDRGVTWPQADMPEEPREDVVDRYIAWYMKQL